MSEKIKPSKNRFILNYSLSVLERNKATKLIKEYKKLEFTKPYEILYEMSMLSIYFLGLAFLLSIVYLALFVFHTDNMESLPEATTRLIKTGLISSTLVILCILLFLIKTKLETFIINKRDPIEKESKELSLNLRINRLYIEQIRTNGSYKVYWSFIKKAYKKREFIFIQTQENDHIVIPIRVFITAEEFAIFYSFVQERMPQDRPNSFITQTLNRLF